MFMIPHAKVGVTTAFEPTHKKGYLSVPEEFSASDVGSNMQGNKEPTEPTNYPISKTVAKGRLKRKDPP